MAVLNKGCFLKDSYTRNVAVIIWLHSAATFAKNYKKENNYEKVSLSWIWRFSSFYGIMR